MLTRVSKYATLSPFPKKGTGKVYHTPRTASNAAGNQEAHMDRKDYDRFYKVCEVSLLVIVLTGWAVTIVLGSL